MDYDKPFMPAIANQDMSSSTNFVHVARKKGYHFVLCSRIHVGQAKNLILR